MELRVLGATGLRVSPIGLGGFPFGGVNRAGWPEQDVYEVALKYVLSDSRVHVANVGMRWPHEVDRNVDLAGSFNPTLDVATLPRLTAGIYREADEGASA